MGQIVSPHFSTEKLTIKRAFEWDRINFFSPGKQHRTCELMDITEEELKKKSFVHSQVVVIADIKCL